MTGLSHYAAYLENEISGIELSDEPHNLYDTLRYFLSLGGKRMRPILTLLSGEIFNIPKEECVHAALSIELFHNFSLIHDDIMDGAPVRRGKPTVHTKWNTNIAILSGDQLYIEAYHQLANYSDHRLALLLKSFNETAIEVCQGQQMDMDFESLETVTEEGYIEMIRLKTSVLLGCALEFGAILGNQDEETRRNLYEFGVSLGIAFQIQDDILDLYGDPAIFGKQVGGDILSNKKTLLFLKAMQTGDNRFNELVRMNADHQKVAHAKILFEELGARKATLDAMNGYYDQAMENLKQLEAKGLKTDALHAVAKFLITREL
ncbi:polyprenyl synthetase family protein [Fluviicola sp.]|uniref:polyprenyl synthetase family protein n=1 Tax=Fluviicola sp. TaxID=1917219 RepID=UPI0031D545F4